MPQHVKIRQFEAFLALAEEQHFGRAADRLGVAQPALSHQIQALERTLGITLFERTNRSVRLSAAGAALVPSARRTLEAAGYFVLESRRFLRGQTGSIAISYSASVAYSGALQDVIGSYRAACPNVKLHLREHALNDQVSALQDGAVDIGFLRPPIGNNEGIACDIIKREDIMLLLPASHRLAKGPAVSLAECQSEVFIVPQQQPGVSFHRHTLDICAAAGFTPKTGPNVRDWVTIASMVALGMGIALAPASLTCVALPGVTFCPIENNKIHAEIAIAHKCIEQTPVVAAFIEHVARHHVI